jgi:hypothetical protein
LYSLGGQVDQIIVERRIVSHPIASLWREPPTSVSFSIAECRRWP